VDKLEPSGSTQEQEPNGSNGASLKIVGKRDREEQELQEIEDILELRLAEQAKKDEISPT